MTHPDPTLPPKARRLLAYGDEHGEYSQPYDPRYEQQRQQAAQASGSRWRTRERDQDYRVLAAILASCARAECPMADLWPEIRREQPGTRWYHRRMRQIEAKAEKRRAQSTLTAHVIEKYRLADLRALDQEVEELYRGSWSRYAQPLQRFRGRVILRFRQYAALREWSGSGGWSQLTVYLALIEVASQAGNLTFNVDERRLAKMAGVRPNTVVKAIKRLAQQGLLVKHERPVGTMSRYTLLASFSGFASFIPVPGCAGRIAELTSATLTEYPAMGAERVDQIRPQAHAYKGRDFDVYRDGIHPAFGHKRLDIRLYLLLSPQYVLSVEWLRSMLGGMTDNVFYQQVALYQHHGIVETSSKGLRLTASLELLDRAARKRGGDISVARLRETMTVQQRNWKETRADTYYPEGQDPDVHPTSGSQV